MLHFKYRHGLKSLDDFIAAFSGWISSSQLEFHRLVEAFLIYEIYELEKCAFPNHINHLSSPARAAKATKMRKYANRINDERQRSISISTLCDRIKTKVNKSITAEKRKFSRLFIFARRPMMVEFNGIAMKARAQE